MNAHGGFQVGISPLHPLNLSANSELASSGGKVRTTVPYPIGVLLIDAKGIMRDGLCTLVAGVREFEIMAVASSPEEALSSPLPQSPEVIVGDFPAFKGSGLESVHGMKARWPRARVLVLTFHSDTTTVHSAFRAGANGYLLKTDTCNELFTALRSIAAGRDFISPSVHGQVVSGYTDREPAAADGPPNPGLTERERQVMRLIAAGHRTREIAEMLSLSHKTIEKHRGSVMRKLGLRNASAVAAYAIAHGLA